MLVIGSGAIAGCLSDPALKIFANAADSYNSGIAADDMSIDTQMMEKYLQRAIDEFDVNPLASKLMRRLANEGPELFYTVAVKHLNSLEQSNALRALAVLLVRQDTLPDRLVSPAYSTRESAIKLFRRFLEVDPSFDVRLARKLPGRSYWNHAFAFDGLRSARALDILDETSQGRRLLPILGHLPESDDPRISSKATLFVGRRVQNPAWTKRQLERKDQRIRANAVEALWGVTTPPAVQLLEQCVSDANNRVVGNSLVGLHIAGREDAQREVMTLSRGSKPALRCTAAWAMGKIAVPTFTRRLTELVRDEQPQVRSTALRALMDIRRMEVKTPEAIAEEVAGQAPEVIAGKVEKAAEDILPRNWA